MTPGVVSCYNILILRTEPVTMADIAPATQAPLTEEALLADRLSFWASFTSYGTMAAGAVILLVLAMWIFLV